MTWRCTQCGRTHEGNDPPCETCGNERFERLADGEAGTVDTAPAYIWVCPNCGRQHVKNSPPCSRCGNPDLEKREQRYEDLDTDLEVPGWLEVARPYSPVILVLVVVVGLFATGLVPLSVLPGVGTPTPPDAPGEGTEASGIDLEATELAVHDRLEAERTTAEVSARSYDDGLAAFAEYRNRQLVIAHDEGTEPADRPPLGEFDPACSDGAAGVDVRTDAGVIEEYEDEDALAAFLADELLEEHRSLLTGEGQTEGLDVHVGEDGSVFVYYVAC
ncbi:zinc-ribbon domain-containing protein [Natrononativus amylolyticus]|uniref:zinc-ribbon domain-containing protein n=1 Tax=Natrononativus amylolyticus TaxID=2963434 RepID=UPI0020CF0053|nr:zinc-ribbon domain-containing protein [Natrononativus amylolyticus]